MSSARRRPSPNDPVSALLNETALENRALAWGVFSFVLNHSTNAVSCKTKSLRDNPTRACLFEWLLDVAKDFCNPKKKQIQLKGDHLWVSKKIVFDLKELKNHSKDRVRELMETKETCFSVCVKGKTGYNSDASCFSGYAHSDIVQTCVVEMDFPGMLLYYLMYRIKNDSLFSSRRNMIRQFFDYAKSQGQQKEITHLEELYETVAFSWGMHFEDDGPHTKEPWNQTWRHYPGRFGSVQKVLDILTSRVTGPPTKPFLMGAWIMGAGMDGRIRRWVLKNKPEWNAITSKKWVSFIVPYADPLFFADTAGNPDPHTEEDLQPLKLFLSVVAVTHNSPETYDCAFNVWMDLATRAEHRDMFVSWKPHLKHVVARLARLVPLQQPDEGLCRKIMQSARQFTEDKKKQGNFHQAEHIHKARQEEGFLQHLKIKLRGGGCVKETKELQALEVSKAKIHIFAFEEGGTVSWVDLTYTVNKIWAKELERERRDEVILIRTPRESFLVITDDLLNVMDCSVPNTPSIFSHPLNALGTWAEIKHPLWSKKQDLLALCI
jgi:hypothetical protein